MFISHSHFLCAAYMVVGDNFIEENTPVCCCFCCIKDIVTKSYFDMPPFTPTCCGKFKGGWANENDLNYCCYFINCVCIYNICTKPCCGGIVARVPCERGGCGYLCATRCCPICVTPIMRCVKDSEHVTTVLEQAITASRERGKAGGPGAQTMA